MHHPPSPPSDSPLSPALMSVAPSLMPDSTSSPNQTWGPGAANRTQRCLKWIFARPSRCGRRRAATLVVVATVCVLFGFTTIDDRAVAVGVSGKRPDQRGESPDPRSDQMTCEQGKPDIQREYWVWVMVPHGSLGKSYGGSPRMLRKFITAPANRAPQKDTSASANRASRYSTFPLVDWAAVKSIVHPVNRPPPEVNVPSSASPTHVGVYRQGLLRDRALGSRPYVRRTLNQERQDHR